MKLRDFFFDTSQQKILKFLADFPNKTFFEREIALKTRISRGATNIALKQLTRAGLITLEKKGRMSFCSVDLKNPLVRQWKVMGNIVGVYSLIQKLTKTSEKIILFGSTADGTNIKESDIDLFVMSRTPEKIRKIVPEGKVQLVVKKPLEFVEMKSKDSVFYEEIIRGIVLWEKME